jgi:hypothetical protein
MGFLAIGSAGAERPRGRNASSPDRENMTANIRPMAGVGLPH